MKPIRIAALLALALVLSFPAGAAALTVPFGLTGTNPGGGCSSCTTFQSKAATGAYAFTYTVPKGTWTIIIWSVAGGTSLSGDMQLRVFRPTGVTDQYRIVGESSFQPIPPGVVSSFPTSVPVQGGDLLGLTSASNAGGPGNVPIAVPGSPGDQITNVLGTGSMVGDLAGPGGIATATIDDRHVNVAAVLQRPDVDTTITKRPRNRVTRHRVKFKFSSAQPGVTFECALDAGPFSACSSPKAYKVKVGKHRFRVRAVDDGGYVDATPPKDKFKILG